MMGVDYDLFWTMNPKELTPFIKAFSLKRKYEDSMAWQQGAYIRMAIASCLEKTAKYPTKPLFGEIEVAETPEERQKKIRQRFVNHVAMINANMRKES